MEGDQKALENSQVALGVGNGRKPKIDPQKEIHLPICFRWGSH